MFCPKCGKAVAENARFCTQCGNPLTQVVPRNTAQPVVDGLNLFFPDKHNELGRVLIFPHEIVAVECDFIRNSADYLSNFLNNAVVTLRLPVSEIVSGKKARFRINPNAYYITMRNGETFVMIFDNPKTTIPVLDSIINGK